MQYQAPVYSRVAVSKDSAEWRRVQQRLTRSLSGAKLTSLERVQNPHTWDRFYRQCVAHHEKGDCHMDFTWAGSAVQELWHATGAIDAICKSEIGLCYVYHMHCRACCPRSIAIRALTLVPHAQV